MIVDTALLLLFPAAMAIAASMDLFTMTIPNRISLALVAGFFCLAPFAGLGWAEIGAHVATGLAMLALTLLLFWKGWIGGGDAKLFSATCLWFGYEHLLEYAMIAALVGGALTICLVLVRNLPLPASLKKREWVARLHSSGTGVPYGIALAIAALLVYPQTAFMQAVS
ncbi:MAG: prepilin peptidase [Pseudomonadota bacterium]|nr:prepilin peptidase [Pseudomonadota bacterium]